jgi:hypothetical protein
MNVQWQQKPPVGSLVQRGTPVGDSIVGAYLLNESSGRSVNNDNNTGNLVITDSARGKTDSLIVRPGGGYQAYWKKRALYADYYLGGYLSRPDIGSLTDCSFIIGYDLYQIKNDWGSLLSILSLANGNNVNLRVCRWAGANDIGIYRGTGSSPLYISGETLNIESGKCILAITCKGSTLTYYRNGIQKGQITNADVPSSFTDGVVYPWGEVTTYASYGACDFLYAANRAFTRAEVEQVSLNPWSIYMPRVSPFDYNVTVVSRTLILANPNISKLSLSLRSADFQASEFPAGPAGPAGPKPQVGGLGRVYSV